MAYKPEKYIRKDGTIIYTANQNMGGNRLTHLGNALEGTDAINLTQLINALSRVVAVCNTFTTGEPIESHKVVYMNTNERIYTASSSDINQMHRVIGITKESAESGAGVSVIMFGFAELFSNLSAGFPYFFNTTGDITTIAPSIGYTQCIGTALDATKIHINIQVPIGI